MKRSFPLSAIISILVIIIAAVLAAVVLFSQGYFATAAAPLDSEDTDNSELSALDSSVPESSIPESSVSESSVLDSSVLDNSSIDVQKELEQESDQSAENDSLQSIDSNIDKQIVHDNVGYTLKDFWFSKKLPDGVTTADCSSDFGGWMYDSATGEGEMKLVKDYTAEDGTFSYEGEAYTWMFVKMDIQNLFDEDKLINFGDNTLNDVTNNTAVKGYVDYLSLHDNCFVAPEGMDNAFTGDIRTQKINYFNVYFKKGETREVVFGYLFKDKYINDDSVYIMNLNIYGYGSTSLDKIGHLYIR